MNENLMNDRSASEEVILTPYMVGKQASLAGKKPVQVKMRLPEALYTHIQKLAFSKGMSINALLIELLESTRKASKK